MNIECDYVVNLDWDNLDAAPASPIIGSFGCRRRLSEIGVSVDVCHNSHILERLY